MKYHWFLVLLLALSGCPPADPCEPSFLGLDNLFFADDFSARDECAWNYPCIEDPHVLDDVIPNYELDSEGSLRPLRQVPADDDDDDDDYPRYAVGDQARKGQCVHEDGKLKFRVAPFDYRGTPKGPHELGMNKGGAEISLWHHSNHPDVLSADSVLRPGEQYAQWDSRGWSDHQLGMTVVYWYKFVITDTSMLRFPAGEPAGMQFANHFHIFQQHSIPNSDCLSSGNTRGVIDDFEDLSPSLALVLRQSSNSETGLRWEFRTKVPHHPYYEWWKDGVTNKCSDYIAPEAEASTSPARGLEGSYGALSTCYLPLWEKEFEASELGQEITVAVRFTLAQQERWNPDSNPDCEYANLAAAGELGDYEACRPSSGKVELFFNGEQQTGLTDEEGEVTGLPWIEGKQVFEGISTQFNLCPSYPKLGVYAIGYDFENWQEHYLGQAEQWPQSLEDVPMIGVDYLGFRIGGSLEAVTGSTTGGVFPPDVPADSE